MGMKLEYLWAPAISVAYGPEKDLPGAEEPGEGDVLLLVQTDAVVITGTKGDILDFLDRARAAVSPPAMNGQGRR